MSCTLHTKLLNLTVCAVFLMGPAWAETQQNVSGPTSQQRQSHPADVRPLSDLPPEIREMRESLEFCRPLPELDDRKVYVFSEDPTAFSQFFVVPCAGGGYNLSDVIFLESAGEITLKGLEKYSHTDGWEQEPEIFNPEWDSQTGILTSFLKGRSLGDCGHRGKWWFTEGNLRLMQYAWQPECDGTSVPGEFPLIFDSRSRD